MTFNIGDKELQIIYGVLMVMLGVLIYKHVSEKSAEKYCGCAAGGGSDSETYVDRAKIHKIVNGCSYSKNFAGVL